MWQLKKNYLSPILWMTLVAGSALSAFADEAYVVRPGDTVTTVLFRLGVGTPDSPYRLYGKDNWLERTRLANPDRDIDQLRPGDVIKIPRFPGVSQEETPPSITEEKSEDEKNAEPSTQSTPEPTAMSVEKAQDQAMDVTFFERKSAEAEGFLTFLPPSAAAYIGLRAARSLNVSDDLLSQIVTYGFIAEIRGGTLEGLRLLYEITPEVSARADGYTHKLGYNRALLGWAFEWQAPVLFDLVHVTPRLGRYSVEARYPAISKGTVEDLSISGAMSLGLEADAEFAKYFYVTRFWVAGDFPLSASKRPHETTSRRAGIDMYFKGSAFNMFGRKMSESYLLYTSFEDLRIEGQGPKRGESFHIIIPVMGAGYTLNVN